jgi:hypothetical protein
MLLEYPLNEHKTGLRFADLNCIPAPPSLRIVVSAKIL